MEVPVPDNEAKAGEDGAPLPSSGWSDGPPPAWGMIRISAALLSGAVLLMCLDMVLYLRLWRLLVEAGGMPSPEDMLSRIHIGLLPMALSGAACIVALFASFRARGKYAVFAIMTATTSAILLAILVVMVLVQWCPVALLPAVNGGG